MESMKCVVIPIYKEKLSVEEIISLNQCLRVLYEYEIYLVTYKGLDLSLYEEIFSSFNKVFSVEYFSFFYFDGIQGYNRLMLSSLFYKRFLNYNYILIYQLDVYIFDNLFDYWTSLNYDYIGAPCCFDQTFIWEDALVGNGGFSLRVPRKFFQILNHTGKILSIKSLKRVYRKTIWWKRYLLIVLGLFGYKNNSSYFHDRFSMNEDFFWSLVGMDNKYLKVPPLEEAMQFCFEQSPSELFKRNGERLPWGVHAFCKYEYTFWKKWIK